MFSERIKSSVIVILIVNLIFLTVNIWFINSGAMLKETIIQYVRQIPIVETFFPLDEEYSISKENLSKPRKFLINDGSLWMAYYNTDIGFSPIEERTKILLTGFLNGETTRTKKIDLATWEAGLESLSIYIEYPVSFSPEMFCRIMGVSGEKAPKEISAYREIIILPSSNESDICILARDSAKEESMYAYILSNKYTLPSSDLSVYTNNTDVYYEPAFSTGLELDEKSNVTLAPLVLFSDSHPTTQILHPRNLINKKSEGKILEAFEFNPEMTPYEDNDGGVNYIANYAQATIFPDGVFEYSSVSEDRGILLDGSGNSYNVLNASIDFIEKVWDCVSNEPLSVLVSSDLSDYDSSKAYTFKFDYYCEGRPVKVDLVSQFGHKKMNSAIEITVKNGKLIEYRQYMRGYRTVADFDLSDTFVTSLDYFVQKLKGNSEEPVIISDIYIGYLDVGADNELYATWLAKTDKGSIFKYTAE